VQGKDLSVIMFIIGFGAASFTPCSAQDAAVNSAFARISSMQLTFRRVSAMASFFVVMLGWLWIEASFVAPWSAWWNSILDSYRHSRVCYNFGFIIQYLWLVCVRLVWLASRFISSLV
jgi:hypothetical protein